MSDKVRFVATTYFLAKPDDVGLAYGLYRQRMALLHAHRGVHMRSLSAAARMEPHDSRWDFLREQYRIERGGEVPGCHEVFRVITVVHFDRNVDREKLEEFLFMDDRDVAVEQFPSFVDFDQQVFP